MGRKDTIYHEVGTIIFDDICQNSNMEYDFEQKIENAKWYEMVSIDDFNYSNVLIEAKLYDNEANLTNKKTFTKMVH